MHLAIHFDILHHFIAVGFEAAVEVVEVFDTAHLARSGIEKFGGNGLGERVIAFLLITRDKVVAVDGNHSIKLGDFVRRVLQVGVHRYYHTALGRLKATVQGRRLAVIAAKLNAVYVGVFFCQPFDDLPRVIGAAVIDKDNFIREAVGIHHADNPLVKLGQTLGFVVKRNDNRYVDRLFHCKNVSDKAWPSYTLLATSHKSYDGRNDRSRKEGEVEYKTCIIGRREAAQSVDKRRDTAVGLLQKPGLLNLLAIFGRREQVLVGVENVAAVKESKINVKKKRNPKRGIKTHQEREDITTAKGELFLTRSHLFSKLEREQCGNEGRTCEHKHTQCRQGGNAQRPAHHRERHYAPQSKQHAVLHSIGIGYLEHWQ